MSVLRRYNISEANTLTKPLNLQDITVNPSTESQTITYDADLAYNGINSVTINPVTAAIDENIKPENIVKGISILGVEGTSAGSSKLAGIYSLTRSGDILVTELKAEPERTQNFELYVNGNLYKTYDLITYGYNNTTFSDGLIYYYVQFVPKINLLELLDDGDYTIKGRTIGTLNPSDFTEELFYSCYTVNTIIDDKTHNKKGTTSKQNTDKEYTDTFIVGDPVLNLSYELKNTDWEAINGFIAEFKLNNDSFYAVQPDNSNQAATAVYYAKVKFTANSDTSLKVLYKVNRDESWDTDRLSWVWESKYAGFGFGKIDTELIFPKTDNWGVDQNFIDNPNDYIFTTTNAITVYDENGYNAPSFKDNEPFFYRTEYEIDYGTVSAGEHYFYIVFYKNQNWGMDPGYLFDFQFQVQQSYSDNGYKLPDTISVTVNGVETTEYTYDSSTGKFSIPLKGTTTVSFNSVEK